jgi:hypothetical protein
MLKLICKIKIALMKKNRKRNYRQRACESSTIAHQKEICIVLYGFPGGSQYDANRPDRPAYRDGFILH